jgi:putative redox protein
MVEVDIVYKGDLHCELQHGPSKSQIETDAPKDNQGRGENFSPTDLVAAALGSCMLTVMAISAKKDGLEFLGASAKVTKEMRAAPRKISRLIVNISMPETLSAEARKKLEAVALACPVHHSLAADIDIPVTFIYI